jgi:hypothetical protein
VVVQPAESGVTSFSHDFDEEGAKTLKRPPSALAGPTVVEDEATRRALEEATLRDRTRELALGDPPLPSAPDETSAVSTLDRRAPHVEAAVPTAFVRARDSGPRASIPASGPRGRVPAPGPRPSAPASGPRPSVSPSGPRASQAPMPVASRPGPASAAPFDLGARQARASARAMVRNRGLRIAAMVAGLTGLALVSFAIALAAREGSHAPSDASARPLDPTHPVVALPADSPMAAVTPSAPVDAVLAAATDDALAPGDAGPGLGYLEISTKPDGGTIRVGEQSRTSPAEFVLDAGDIFVTAVLEGYAPEHRVIHLIPQDHEKVEIAMTRKLIPHEHPSPPATGRLSVRTNPYSEVFEGGHRLGETPFADLELPPGPHVLTFKNPKHPTTQKTIVVVAGKAQKLSFDLP